MTEASVLDALVLDLDTRAGLAITRTLARSGLAIAVASREGDASGLRTRCARAKTVLPLPERDLGAYAQGIIDFLTARPARVIIPSTDWSVEALVRLRDGLTGLAAPAIASPDALSIACSKERTLRLANELGLPTPRSITVSSANEASDAVAELGLPAVLKPTSSWRSRGLGGERVGPVYVTSREDVHSMAQALVRGDAPVLVQEFATGARETIKLFHVNGTFVATLAMQVERTWPQIGGSSVMRRTITPPADLVAHAHLLVSSIGLDGYSEVEFRRDGDERPLLMEVNPRLSQSVELAVRAGIDFPRMQFEWAGGGELQDEASYRVDERLGWLAGDLRLLVDAATRPGARTLLGSLGSALTDYGLRRTRVDGFDLHDPGPMAGAIAFAARGGRRHRSAS